MSIFEIFYYNVPIENLVAWTFNGIAILLTIKGIQIANKIANKILERKLKENGIIKQKFNPIRKKGLKHQRLEAKEILICQNWLKVKANNTEIKIPSNHFDKITKAIKRHEELMCKDSTEIIKYKLKDEDIASGKV